MRSPISVKIPKRSESAFPNKGYSTLITSGWPHAFGTQFSNQIRVMRRAGQGREGKGGGSATEANSDCSCSRGLNWFSFTILPFNATFER